jgi:hypothetical protein
MSIAPEGAALTIFCGKGGVGKTSLALAYALRYATRAKRVLVVTSHPLRELAVSVSLAGLKERRPDAAANLFVIHIDPFEILARRVEQVIPSKTVIRRVLASSIYRNLVEVAPGLKELAFLGRLHGLAAPRSADGTAGDYSAVVWDAPATGHFLQTMRVSQNFETYLSGPLALAGKEAGEFFADPAGLAVIPVTTLERMAVDETIELCERLSAELNLRPAAMIGNMVSPLLVGEETASEDFLGWVAESGKGSAYLSFIAERHRNERELLKRLRSTIEVDIHLVQRKTTWQSDLELLMSLSEQLD